MDKTRIEMLDEMFRLQLEEDIKVHEEFGITYEQLLKEGKYFYALLDEFGELTHELKPEWCWWKKNAGESEADKVLEEFSDVTHFILSFCLAMNNGEIPRFIHDGDFYLSDLLYPELIYAPDYVDAFLAAKYTSDILQYVSLFTNEKERVIFNERMLIEHWFVLSLIYGLDFETDVYEPYVKKNAVNQQRVKDGY